MSIQAASSLASTRVDVPADIEPATPPLSSAKPSAASEDAAWQSLPDHYGAPAATVRAFIQTQRSGGSGEGFGRLGTSELEAKVATRKDLDQPLPMAGTMNERGANLLKLTQIDGAAGTSVDRISCGPMCLVAGIYLRNPNDLKKLASFEASKLAAGATLATCAKQLGMKTSAIEDALTSISKGTATPRQLSVLAQTLLFTARAGVADANYLACNTSIPAGTPNRKGAVDRCETLFLEADADPIRDGGARGMDLQNLLHSAGISVPGMQMKLRQVDVEVVSENGEKTIKQRGHWVAEFDMKAKDPQTGKMIPYVLTYDPWPVDYSGSAKVDMAADHQQTEERHLHRGAADGHFRVNSNGIFSPIRG